MSIFDVFRKKRPTTLRELCRREYGDEFVRMYDDVCDGIPIGGFAETIMFIEMVEAVRENHKSELEVD